MPMSTQIYELFNEKSSALRQPCAPSWHMGGLLIKQPESAETHAGLVRKNYDGTTLEGRFRELMVLYLAIQPR